MSAGDYTMKICQGSDFKLVLTITDENTTPIDLTGHVFSGQIRKYISSPDIVASFTFNLLDQVTNTGQVEILMSAATSTAIVLPEDKGIKRKAVKYAYDIESANGGETKRWLEGVVEISPEVTR